MLLSVTHSRPQGPSFLLVTWSLLIGFALGTRMSVTLKIIAALYRNYVGELCLVDAGEIYTLPKQISSIC